MIRHLLFLGLFGVAAHGILLDKLGLVGGGGGVLVPHDPDLVKFYFYHDKKRLGHKVEFSFRSKEDITASDYQKDKKTVLLIHGFWSDLDTEFPKMVKDAYLESDLGYNIIVVDWSKLSRSKESSSRLLGALLTSAYPTVYPGVVKRSAPPVGERVKEFLDFMIDKKFLESKNLHIIGFGVGAHIAGLVGRKLKKEDNKVARITGLDPAGPLFDGKSPAMDHLQRSDAEFVDVYHTSEGTRGFTGDLGHADFYPNGGKIQPLCIEKESNYDGVSKGHCSHMYAANIYAATIAERIKACQCDHDLSPKDIHKCYADCPNSVIAGEPLDKKASGHYYFEFFKEH